MKKNIIIVLLLGLIGFYILFTMAVTYLAGYDYELVSEQVSPDGRYTLFEVESLSEAGHAPYGQQLVLASKDSFRKPSDGYVIFAAYCQRPLDYSWLNDKNIQIHCKGNEQEPIRTMAKMVYGINVEVLIE